MAGPQNLSIPGSRTKGLMSNFVNLYFNRFKQDQARLVNVMGFIDSLNNARDETFWYPEAVPGFRRWDEGEPRTYGTVGDRTFTVSILKWEDAVQWKRIDEEDDLSRRLRPHLQSIANKAGLIDVEVFFQILTAGTDLDRLSSIPNAADGNALSSSSTRFGDTGGNIVTGSGAATTAAIKADYFEVRRRMNAFQDTQGELLHDDGIFDRGVTIIFGDSNLEKFAEAFGARTIQGVAAGIDNVLYLKETLQDKITLWATSRITDDDWFVFLDDYPEKAIFALQRNDLGGLEEVYADENNSDFCRDNDVRRLLWRIRRGYGVALPYNMMKVDN
jgi:hypothetical protein